MGPRHAQACGPLVHQPHKLPLCARYVLRHGHGGVISRGDDNALDKSLHRLDLPLLQKYLGAAHGFGVGTGHHLVRQRDFSLRQGVENENQRHDLCHAGRGTLLVRPLLVDHLSRGGLHEDGAGGRHLKRCGLGLGLHSGIPCRAHSQGTRRYGKFRLLESKAGCPGLLRWPCGQGGRAQYSCHPFHKPIYPRSKFLTLILWREISPL